ncbi:hypothetical protein BDD26_2698 [Xenorhabdus cabanillasii]|uniref:Uncharacterized protein n=1 Tax=Xenorhabdus cabanillasii TaxID=351673 RepID=A0A3D9UEG4_9GAMM|nr:hypothetical protein [Xenorhabdus cabanillasii]REF27872.1 hypothetical protein BDD26_2698 [Xenorhabdus cabanillasii]
MDIENILRLVTRRAQNTFKAGSSTHIPYSTKDIDCIGDTLNPNIEKFIDTFFKVHTNVEKMRNTLIQRKKDDDIPYSYAYYTVNKFRRNLAGNCHELSDYALHELMKLHSLEIFHHYRKIDRNPTFIVSCSLTAPYDHVFIMIYHPRTCSDDIQHEFDKLNTLQPEAWICDPWADIICQGSQYPFEWQKKMQIWYVNDHYVPSVVDSQKCNEIKTDMYNQCFSPLRQLIFTTIRDKAEVILLNRAFIDGTGKLYQLTDKNIITDYNTSEMNNMSYTKLFDYYKE